MAKFKYQAKRGPHNRIEGRIEAASEEEAINLIVAQGLFPIEVTEEEQAYGLQRRGFLGAFQRITSAQLLDFTRQLHNLISAHVELLKALYILREQSENLALRDLLDKIYNKVKEGGNFSAALAEFPKIFSSLYMSLIKAGETSGRLDSALERIVLFLEEKEDLKRKVIAGLAYPAMMVLVGLGTIVALVTFVIPRLTTLFTDFDQELPLITKALLFVSAIFSSVKFWLIIAALIVVFMVYQKLSPRKISFNGIIRKIPVFRKISLLESVTHFSYAFGMLLQSGVSVLEALNVSRLSLEYPHLADEVDRLKEGIAQGVSLAEGIGTLESFPKFFCRMLVIGEESGLLPKVMETVTVALKKELEMRLKIISSLIEPAIILAVGLILGTMVIAMLLPIFQMSSLSM